MYDQLVWEYTTDNYPTAQVYSTKDVGETSYGYLITENGSVVCLDKQSGNILWKVEAPSNGLSCFDEEESVYVTTALGFSAAKIDKTGNKIWQIEDQDYMWPSEMQYLAEGMLEIAVCESGSPEDITYLYIDAVSGSITGESAQ